MDVDRGFRPQIAHFAPMPLLALRNAAMVPLDGIGPPIENYEFPVIPFNYRGELASRAGLEPAIYRLGGGCVIQLR